MKKFLACAVLLFAALAAQAQTATPATGPATTVTISWTPVPATPGLTISGYTATLLAPPGNTITIPACATATSTNCIQPGQSTASFVYAPGGNIDYGQWTATITTNATNSAGTALTAQATGTGTYAVAPVTVVPAVGGVTIQFTIPAPATQQ